MVKRGGAVHRPLGLADVPEGSCAVLCPACPQPGMNIPLDWEKHCPPSLRFAYRVTLAVDGNFKLKLRSNRAGEDLPLGDGIAYMINSDVYDNWQKTVPNAQEVSPAL